MTYWLEAECKCVLVGFFFFFWLLLHSDKVIWCACPDLLVKGMARVLHLIVCLPGPCSGILGTMFPSCVKVYLIPYNL